MKDTLKVLRERAGKTRAEVATALNITTRAVYNYETGIRRLSIEQVIPLAELYGVSIEELVKTAVLNIQ